MAGGISGLLGLISQHRGAVEYDWRTRFGMPLMSVGGPQMTITEAGRLALLLVDDPSTATAAAISGWDYRISRESLLLLDLLDSYAAVNFKKPKPRSRPWATTKQAERKGDVAGRSPEEVRAILAAHGHAVS